MRDEQSKLKLHHARFSLSLASLGLVFITSVAFAQTFIEPSAPPPGGRSANFLDTTATTQRKLGTLIIGAQTGGKLCLNAANSSSSNCLSSWVDLLNPIGGPYVQTHDGQTQGSLEPWFQAGYMHIRGNSVSASDTIIATTNPLANSYAVWGENNRDNSNYAGYFSGKVQIVNHYGLGNPGEICLNNTVYPMAGPAGSVYGCIRQWTDIVGGPAGPYIKVQPTDPPLQQAGSGRISKAWQMGSLVVGDGAVGYGTSFCGDGLCSPGINENTGSCASDCSGFSGYSFEIIDPCQNPGDCDSGTISPPGE